MSYTEMIRRDSPYAYWPFQETSGLTATDVIGNKVLTWNGSAVVTTNDTDTGIFGEGENRSTLVGNSPSANQYATCSFSWDPVDFTIEWWVKPTAKVDYTCGVCATSNTSYTWGNFCFHGSSTDPYVGTSVGSRLDPSNGMSGFWSSGVWTHVACAYNDASNLIRIYKNGAFFVQKTSIGGQSGAWTGMLIGSSDSNPFHGRIQHLAVFGSQLTDADIARHYREGKRGGVTY